jgi:cell division septal protein FtsQ
MWFKRKSKNRRLGREHVLDVKLRSSQVRAARLRMVAVSLAIMFGTVFGLFLLWRTGEWALDRLVYDNKAFAIQEIDVQTDGVISVAQLRRWMGVKPGQNLLALDLSRVKRDLELVPLVQSVSVERILPRTLRIRVVEREPLAQINAPRPRPGGGLELAVFQLDIDGYVMLPLDSHQRANAANQPAEQLPLISGIAGNELQPGRRIETPQVQASLQLIAAFEHSPMAGLVELKHIDVSAPDVLVVTTGQGSEVTFGLQELDQQLRRWRGIFDLGQKMGKSVSVLDLSVTDNIPARWVEASGLPPSALPRLPKPLRTKRTHV